VIQAAQVTKDELDAACQRPELVPAPVAGAGDTLAGGSKRQRLSAAGALTDWRGGQQPRR